MSDTEFIMKPKNDYCFKELMLDEEIRKGFLAACLHIKPSEIKETMILPTQLHKEYEDLKEGIIDVHVLMWDGTQIDIEVQVLSDKFWQERSIFYLCKMYTEVLKKGEPYSELKKCIHIGILDFSLFPNEDAFYSQFHLREDNRGILYSDKLEIHVLELPKLKQYEDPNDTLLNWARFINSEKKEEMKAMAKNDEYIGKAYDQLVKLSADEAKRLEYEAREKAIRDRNNYVKQYYSDGKEKGREEGREEGRKEMIQKMLKKGYDDEAILELSEISEKQLEAIKSELDS